LLGTVDSEQMIWSTAGLCDRLGGGVCQLRDGHQLDDAFEGAVTSHTRTYFAEPKFGQWKREIHEVDSQAR
jgi:hypothetical protein